MASSGDGYGPDGCVSTWKNPSGRCVVKTDCRGLAGHSEVMTPQFVNYDFGFVCVDEAGMPSQHLFGKGSFSSAETFDTLITCEECLGLENLPEDVAQSGQIGVLNLEVTDLKEKMAVLWSEHSASVASPAAAPVNAPASFMLHKSEQVETADEGEQLEEPQPPPQPKVHHGGRKAAKKPKLRASLREDDIPVAQAQDETSAGAGEDGSADAYAGTEAYASALGSSDDSASRDDASAGDRQQAQQQDADGASDSQEQQPPQDVEVDDGFDG